MFRQKRPVCFDRMSKKRNLCTAHESLASSRAFKTLCKEGRLQEAFEAIRLRRVRLSKDVLFSLLLAAIEREDIHAGRNIDLLMSSAGFYRISILADHLIRLFALCGSLSEANSAFRKVANPSVYTWNSIISAHGKFGLHEQVLALSQEMQNLGAEPDGVTFSCLLKACGSLQDLRTGELFHFHLLESCCESHVITESVLVDFYAKCGCLQEARKIFDTLKERDVVTWGTMIAAYTQHGNGLSALGLFHQMLTANVKPTMVVFSSVLKSCGILKALEEGMLIHERLESDGLCQDVVVASSLVDMYSKCGSIKEARTVFDEMKVRDLVSWGAMILAYASNDNLHDAFHLLDIMQSHGLIPNNVILDCLLRACGTDKYIEHGKHLHSYLIFLGLNDDPHTIFVLSEMYAHVGAVEEAGVVFLRLPCLNVQLWDAFIAENVEYGNDAFALNLFYEMQENGVAPNKSTILHVSKACEGAGCCLQNCMLLHHHVVRDGFESESIMGSTLLNFYAKCGSVESMKTVFERLHNPDVVAWGAMIQGSTHLGNNQSAVETFERMLKNGLNPTNVIFSSMAKACGSLGVLKHGRWIHDQIVRTALEKEVIVGSSLIDMYARCGCLLDAQTVCLKLPNRDPTAWGAIIAGCAANAEVVCVFDFFEQMQLEGFVPDKVVFSSLLKACGCLGDLCQGRIISDQIICSGVAVDVILENSLIDMYAKCGSLDEARKVFDGFITKDIVSWGTMISAYVSEAQNSSAFELFEMMEKQGIRPNKVVFLSCLKACGATGCLLWGRLVHDQVIRAQLDLDREIGNILVDVYGKFGSIAEAERLLMRLPTRDGVSWASMITALSQNAKVFSAKECVQVMQKQGLKPVNTNFISLLSSCTHAGMLKYGIDCFEDMSEDYGFLPKLEPFSCMIDLLARTGCQREAEDLIQTMPNTPDIVVWTSVLTSCKTFGSSSLA